MSQNAILKGQGEWVVDSKRFFAPTRLLKFKVQTSKLLQPFDMDDVIDEMTKATDGIWDHVDPTDPNQIDDAAEEPGVLP